MFTFFFFPCVLLSFFLQSEPPRGRNRAQSVGGWSGATASFLSSLPPLHPLPQTKHNINNIDYTNKIATIPVSVMTDYETPQPRKRSQTRVLATEKARESYTEAAAIVENLKTAVEGKKVNIKPNTSILPSTAVFKFSTIAAASVYDSRAFSVAKTRV